MATICEFCGEEVGGTCFNCVLENGLTFSYTELTPNDMEALEKLGFEAICDADWSMIRVRATEDCLLLF